MLLEGAEIYGLGSWADIADHIGGFRQKDEVRDHYIKTYVETKNFPLPDRADPFDLTLTDEVPREEFQARKKRRIEERKEAQKNTPPAPPKQKPTASVPTCHEIGGYMPGRLEFETELHNDAEEAVQHMQFDPNEGAINLRTGAVEPEFELKMAIMDIYNSKLTGRAQRKKSIFEHNLLEYRKFQALDKKRSKEERELFNKSKPLIRITNNVDFQALTQGLEYEHNLRQAIAQLQDWRHHNIGDLKTGDKYEAEKALRLARPAPTGAFDRLPGSRPPKPPVATEIPQSVQQLVAPELPERLKSSLRPASASAATLANGTSKSSAYTTSTLAPSSVLPNKSPQPNGTATTNGINGVNAAAPLPRSTYNPLPIPGTNPLKLHPNDASDLHLLTAEERELCSALRLSPKAYLVMKEALLREATRQGGGLKRKAARELLKVESRRSQGVWEFLCRGGWIGRN